MKTKLLGAVAASALSLSFAGTAHAVFFIDEGNVGGTGIHSLGGADQTGNLVLGTVGVGGETVTFTSTDVLTLNGKGEATIDADPLNNLLVTFISAYNLVGWNVEMPTGDDAPAGPFTMFVSVNGGSTAGVDYFTVSPLDPPQKYFIKATEGDVIQTLGFTFQPGVDAMKQFRLTIGDGGNTGNEIPEPATWALMIMGFGAAGAVLRRRRAAMA